MDDVQRTTACLDGQALMRLVALGLECERLFGPRQDIEWAFVEGKLEAPKHLARTVHDLYFAPKYEEFRPRTIWSLSNAFTSAFKELDPIPQFKATAKLGEFLEARFSQSS